MNWLTGSSKQNEIKKLMTLLGDPAQRDSAAWELIKLGEESTSLLLTALGTQDAALIPLYEQILARIPSATPALIHQLKTAHPIIRGRAAETFYFSKDKAAIPALLDALKGEYFTVRARAAMALANMDEPRLLPHLMPLLKDKEDEVRSYACMAIGKFRDPSTFDEIANILLDDPKIEVRQSAARTFAEMKHPASIPYLMEALRDSFWWFERETQIQDLLNALENFGAEIVEPLIEALADKEANVRRYAAILLGRLKDIRAIEELGMTLYDLHNDVGRAAAEAIAVFGSPAVDYLLEALRHPEADIRENAVYALTHIQDVRVGGLLVEMLNDPDRNVQKQALNSLGELRDSRTRSAIQAIAANRADREMSALAKQILEKSASK